ncbi:MAG: DUF455 family protein, partial [Bdellovibrionota bacterium]
MSEHTCERQPLKCRGEHKTDWFAIRGVREKIAELPGALKSGLSVTQARREFALGRDIDVASRRPEKGGLASREGQARLVHDLANIELQAMELAVRTLHEFPDAPPQFRRELAEIAEGECRHLRLCLDALENLGFEWGHWAARTSLWDTVGPGDSLIDRVVIVHRYLEGSGLDAGESILRRLAGVSAPAVRPAVETIVREEVDHVAFGSLWYRRLCEREGIDPERDFISRIEGLSRAIPRREKIAAELRACAGFTTAEIDALSAA